MKRIALIPILMILSTSCEKQEFQKDLAGDWKIGCISGGLFPTEITPNFNNVSIKRNDNYFVYRGDQIIANGKYSFHKEGYDNYRKTDIWCVRFSKGVNSDPTLNFPIDINLDVRFFSRDTVIFYETDWTDGFQYAFIRLN